MKRLFDVTASLVGLILFSPLLLFVAIWIKLDSPGPVFYRGKRAGRYGKPFAIYKFRSMVMNADKLGGPSTSGDDPRVTKSGRFIRRFKLDEITQLINVLVGDMSLVGPRPEVVSKVERYSEEERETLNLRPGITDWASIWNADEGGVLAGIPDPDAAYEKVIRPRKMELQRYYYRTRNMWIEVKIILFTIWKIIRQDFIPKELKNYPSFDQLRAEALAFAAGEPQTSATQSPLS